MRLNSLIAVPVAALMFGGFCFGDVARADPATPCKAPAALTDLEQALPHTAAQLAAGEPVKIVAIGSSSTAGAGATTPAQSYPSRLAVELGAQFPRSQITVINRGINGQESGDIVARLQTDVLDEKPTLVIWQVGTNSVLRDHSIENVAAHINSGVTQMKGVGADVILVDPQFAPRVIAKSETDAMVKQISASAKKHKVGVFHRFEVMRHWREVSAIPFETFVASDGLHHNDWSYGCWAKLMSVAITQSASKPTMSARVAPAKPE